MELSLWQKKQATLLYHYASIDYLRPLQRMVNDVIKGIDITLQLASDEGRDRLVVGELGWEARDTSANWSTYAFPALLDLQKSVARQIAHIAFEAYGITGVYNCQRTMGERSMMWATPDEEDRFEKQMEALANYAYPIDCTMYRGPLWDDESLYSYWQNTKESFSRIPQFCLREDVQGESGGFGDPDKKPPRTGVYAPIDDPYGALQFAWTGDDYGQLCNCTTFSQLGLEAVAAIGWDNVIKADRELQFFIQQSRWDRDYRSYLHRITAGGTPSSLEQWNERLEEVRTRAAKGGAIPPEEYNDPRNAALFFSYLARVDLPRKWVYVEMLPDTYEELAVVETAESVTPPTSRLRAEPNDLVPKTGWWRSQAKPNGQALHYFEAGQRFPDWHTTQYGSVIWGFNPDEQKEPPKR